LIPARRDIGEREAPRPVGDRKGIAWLIFIRGKSNQRFPKWRAAAAVKNGAAYQSGLGSGLLRLAARSSGAQQQA
jgi:hypothetical protein